MREGLLDFFGREYSTYVQRYVLTKSHVLSLLRTASILVTSRMILDMQALESLSAQVNLREPIKFRLVGYICWRLYIQ